MITSTTSTVVSIPITSVNTINKRQFLGYPRVEIVGQSMWLKLERILEQTEPEDTPIVPTPYFTPDSFFDLLSPPSTPTPMELAMCIAYSVPPRWARLGLSAPRPSSLLTFTPFLDYTLTSSQAWSTMMKMGQMGKEMPRCQSGIGLGLDVSGIGDDVLVTSLVTHSV
jgi:hypothetical protein